MMKIRAVITFAIAQVASAKWHASRRSANIVVEDRAISREKRNFAVPDALARSSAKNLG